MSKPWSNWRIDQWLTYLENRHSQEIQMGLGRVLEVARALDLNTPRCKVVTVAGTNGKGSTVKALETIYDTAGYKVGSYTSPHLIHFNERIRINHTPISDSDLCNAFAAIEEGRGTTHLTYFETATLAALWHFTQQKLDILILEVGLGGRLDATNIVDADVSIITTIDFDHQDYLGTTLEAIGYEKAGILRPNKPFIYADLNPPLTINSKAESIQAQGYFLGQHYSVEDQDSQWEFKAINTTFTLNKPKIQLKSAGAAVMASEILQDSLPITAEQLNIAMADIFIAGRLQLVPGVLDVLYDVSHNAQSARLLAHLLDQLKKKGRIIHAIFSALKDKDLFNLISPLKDCVDRWYPAQLDNKRASTAELLLDSFKGAEIFVEICYNSPLIAFKAALEQAKAGDLIVVYGSFFTVSQVMASQPYMFE